MLVEELIARDIERVEPPKPLRVMIVAENASFVQGGASFLAVQWFRHLLREGVDVHLLVHIRSKAELDQSLSTFSSRIHYVPEVFLQTICWKVGNAIFPPHVRDFTSGWVVHLITQFMQRRLARRLIQQYKIDIIHEPTPVAPRLPSMIYGLGVPVVMGPNFANFRGITEGLLAHDALRIASREELQSVLGGLLKDPGEAGAMGARARRVFEQQAGATDRCVRSIGEILEGPARALDAAKPTVIESPQ